MKAIVEAREFAIALRIGGAYANEKMFSTVQISSFEDRLQVSSTNLEQAIFHTINAHWKDSTWVGAIIVVNAKRLLELVSSMKGLIDLDFDTKKSILKIKSETSTNQIKGEKPNTWPHDFDMVRVDAPVAVTIPDFNLAIAKVRYATNRDHNRPHLHGIHFKSYRKHGMMEAADGFRYSRYTFIEYEEENRSNFDFTVPVEAIVNMPGNVEIKANSNHAELSNGKTTVFTSLVTGNYPDLDQVTPQDPRVVMHMDIASVKRMALRASSFARELHLAVTGMPHALKFFIESAEVGSTEETIEADGEGIENVRFNIHPVFLAQALEVLDNKSGEEMFTITTHGSPPIVLTPFSEKNPFAVIMPMMVHEPEVVEAQAKIATAATEPDENDRLIEAYGEDYDE